LTGGENNPSVGKKVRFSDEQQESISIKLINSRKNDLSRKHLTSFKENISMARLLPFKDRVVLEEIESAENLDSGPSIPAELSKKCSFEEEERKSFKKISIVMFE
jgi:hypothetical protein